MEIVLLPAFLGLIIKICFLFTFFQEKTANSHKINKNTLLKIKWGWQHSILPYKNHVAFLVGGLALHNLCELNAIASWLYNGSADFGMKSYYATTIVLLALILRYSIEVSGIEKLRKLSPIIVFYSLGLAVLALLSPLIIAGSEGIGGYSVTAIRGDYYYLYQIWTLGALFSTFAILFYSITTTKQASIKINSSYVLIAFLPIILTGAGVVVLMQAGYQINASMFMPLATAIFCWVISTTRESREFYDVRQKIPFSRQWRLNRKIAKITNQYTMGKISFQQANRKIEVFLLDYSINENDGNISKTAEAIGLPRSTVYSKRNK